MPVFHPVSVVHRVADVATATSFFTTVLAMPIRLRGSGWTVVDNGSISIRLEPGEPVSPLRLDLTTPDPDAVAGTLTEVPGISVVAELHWATPERQEVHLAAPEAAVLLVVSRDYDEDELGVVPELPTTLVWHDEANALVRRLLRAVPIPFRAGARVRITERAEALALSLGDVEVSVHRAIQGVVQVTPAFQLGRLRQQLVESGFDPGEWEADFERD